MDLLIVFQILAATSVLGFAGEAAVRWYAMGADKREHTHYLNRITARAWCPGCDLLVPGPLMGWDTLDRYRCPDCRKDPT